VILIAAALAVHVALGLAVHGGGTLPGDVPFGDTHTAVGVVKVLTNLGAFYVTAPLAIAVALRRRTPEAVALVAGVVLLLLLVTPLKELWDRPRPPHPLAHAAGLAYPSGHAAYAVTWLAAARTLGRWQLPAALVVIAVMASRLYLHVHYLSDVVGGAALAVAVFALAGLAARRVEARRTRR
jgi:undecaprenyl-diphosphatase